MKLFVSITSILSLLSILLVGEQGAAYSNKSLGKPVGKDVRRVSPSHKRSKYSYKQRISRKRSLKKRRIERYRLRKKYKKRQFKRKRRTIYRYKKNQLRKRRNKRYTRKKRRVRRHRLRRRRSKRYTHKKRRVRRQRLSKRRSKRYTRKTRRVRRYLLSKRRSKRYIVRKQRARRYRLSKRRRYKRKKEAKQYLLSQRPASVDKNRIRRDGPTVKYRAEIHKVDIQRILRKKLSSDNLQNYDEKLSTLEFDIYIEDSEKKELSNKEVKRQIVPIRQKANLSFLKGFFNKVSFDDSSYDNDLVKLNGLEKDKQIN